MEVLLLQLKKIMRFRTCQHKHQGFNKWKLYHLLKFLFCLVLCLSIFCLGILPNDGLVNVYAANEDSLQEIPFDYLYVSSDATHEHNYNSDNAYEVFLANNCNLLCYLSEPSLFEVPYLVTLEFELPNSYIQNLDSCIFKPRSVKANGQMSGSTASTWGSVEVRYQRSNGTIATDNYYDYDENELGIVCPLDDISTTDITVHFTVKFWYTNRVGQLGYGVHCEFERLSNNQDRNIWITVKTDSEEIAQLKTIAKNTEDTASGISGILEFLPNMLNSIGDFFSDLIDTIVQKFSDLIDDITDLFSDLTTSLSGFFSNLTSAISGFFSNLIQNLVDLFNEITDSIQGFFEDLTTAIGQFFADLWQSIENFFTWLFIPDKQDIQDMIEGFSDFWGDGVLTAPIQFITRILASLNTLSPSDCVNQTITVPRWYMNINGTNHRMWTNQNLNLMDSNGMVYYLLNHDFSSGSYPYINANTARLGGFYVFWIFAIFRVIKSMADLLGVGEFIYNKIYSKFIDGEIYDV